MILILNGALLLLLFLIMVSLKRGGTTVQLQGLRYSVGTTYYLNFRDFHFFLFAPLFHNPLCFLAYAIFSSS